jgi:hypothetical protein
MNVALNTITHPPININTNYKWFFLFYHTECTKIIYYSNGEKKSYEDAEKYCHSMNSKMLTYGSTIVDAAEKCKMSGFAWLSKPWIKYRGLIYIKKKFTNIHQHGNN